MRRWLGLWTTNMSKALYIPMSCQEIWAVFVEVRNYLGCHVSHFVLVIENLSVSSWVDNYNRFQGFLFNVCRMSYGDWTGFFTNIESCTRDVVCHVGWWIFNRILGWMYGCCMGQITADIYHIYNDLTIVRKIQTVVAWKVSKVRSTMIKRIH